MTNPPTPSPHQHEPAPFTIGSFSVETALKSNIHYLLVNRMEVSKFVGYEEAKANAEICAASLNSATALHEAGYDAQRVIEALPEIMRLANTSTPYGHWQKLLEKLRRTKDLQ